MMSGGEWKGLCVLQFINEYFHTPLNSFVLITMILVLNGTREHFAIMRVLAGIQIYGFLFFFTFDLWIIIYGCTFTFWWFRSVFVSTFCLVWFMSTDKGWYTRVRNVSIENCWDRQAALLHFGYTYVFASRILIFFFFWHKIYKLLICEIIIIIIIYVCKSIKMGENKIYISLLHIFPSLWE